MTNNKITVSDLNELADLIRKWGTDRGIIGDSAKATQQTQFVKLLEEVAELNEAIKESNQPEIIDAIGDCTVVLILLAELAGTTFEACLDSAYSVISKRTGKMVDGMFIKDTPAAPASDDDDFNEPLGTPQGNCDGDVCESCQ
jgi:NTP pyrophosphatase (non-canonical NTP hydrolase)